MGPETDAATRQAEILTRQVEGFAGLVDDLPNDNPARPALIEAMVIFRNIARINAESIAEAEALAAESRAVLAETGDALKEIKKHLGIRPH